MEKAKPLTSPTSLTDRPRPGGATPKPCPPVNPQRRGRVKRAAERLFMLAREISTGDLAEAGYPRKVRRTPRDYEWMRRVLARYAKPVGRGDGRGRPLLWRLRNSSEDDNTPTG